jgi:uridine kinase
MSMLNLRQRARREAMKFSTWLRANNFRVLFITVVTVKIFFLFSFNSEYVTKFFLPFVEYFSREGSNPWHYFWQQGSGIEFPYNPLMLYLLAFFVKCGQLISASPTTLNVLLKIPILLADTLLTYLMLRTTKNKPLETLFFLSLAPILVYTSFMHAQLDIIPTALLFLSVYLIRLQKPLHAGAIFGAALATKFHVAAAGPLLAIYLWKNRSSRTALKFCALAAGVYGFFVAPFIWSVGFYRMVLTHPKQMMLFDVAAQLGELKLLVPLFALLVLYGRFFTYKKINFDLLDSFLAITFAILVFFIIPAPAWYLWMLPFVALLFIRNYQQNKLLVLLYLGFNFAYLLFFVFFHIEPGIIDLLFFGQPINLKIMHLKLAHITFTVLESTLFLVIYFVYKAGIKSNELYARQQNLVIGISGDSGTGKSTLMNHFINIFGSKATLIEGDGDHRWERGDTHWQEFTHLNPKANFLHRQAEHILLLKNHQPAWRINYNHHSGKFDTPQKINPTDFILLSGLHPFYLPKMRKLTDVKIYLDPQEKIKQHWKIVRDMRERGHSKERILEQMNRRTDDIKKYIAPQKDFADIIIHYFTTDAFEVGDSNASFRVQLKTVFDSSITIDPLLQALIQAGIAVEWNYADDLHSQELILDRPLPAEVLKQLHANLLPNIDELFSNSIERLDGFDGFVQFICLMVISEKMKERDAS